MDIRKVRSLKGEPAVLDNNVICDFIELQRLEILNEIFSAVLIPESIYTDEIRDLDAQQLEKLAYTLVSFSTEEAFNLFYEISTSRKKLSE